MSILSIAFHSQSQDNKVYWTGGGEWIFSFVDASDGQNEWGSVMRFSPVFNFQTMANYDLSEHLGIYSGLAVRNVGFIADTEPGTRKKYRTYNLGIPIGIKIGNMDRMFLFGGYEFDLPFVYKEKTFENEEKTDKAVIWFSDRNSTTMHSLFAGVNFPFGMSLKFKYYLSNFFNQDYSAVIDGTSTMPYENVEATIFYFSLSFKVFEGKEFYYKEYY